MQWMLTPESGMSMFRKFPGTELEFLHILTVSVSERQAGPVFAAIHEIGHWILGHPKDGQFLYGDEAEELEQEAHYFAFVLVCTSASAAGTRSPLLTWQEILRISALVLVPGVFKTDKELTAELIDLSKGHA